MTASTLPKTKAKDSLLRFAIRLDGVVVAALGAAMVATAGSLSRLTGLPTGVEYGIGLLSIAYGPLAFWLAAKPKVRTIGVTVAALNGATTLGLVAVVAAGLLPSTAGAALALAVGGYTAVIGAAQYLGVKRLRA
jgi:hypothetical protein